CTCPMRTPGSIGTGLLTQDSIAAHSVFCPAPSAFRTAIIRQATKVVSTLFASSAGSFERLHRYHEQQKGYECRKQNTPQRQMREMHDRISNRPASIKISGIHRPQPQHLKFASIRVPTNCRVVPTATLPFNIDRACERAIRLS